MYMYILVHVHQNTHDDMYIKMSMIINAYRYACNQLPSCPYMLYHYLNIDLTLVPKFYMVTAYSIELYNYIRNMKLHVLKIFITIWIQITCMYSKFCFPSLERPSGQVCIYTGQLNAIYSSLAGL